LSHIHKADASEGGCKEEGSKGQELTGTANNGEKNETVVCEDPGSFIEFSESKKIIIIREYHESLIDEHTGISRTYERLESYINWPNRRRNMESYTTYEHILKTRRWQWRLLTLRMLLLK
jgi:hypothetical protein